MLNNLSLRIYRSTEEDLSSAKPIFTVGEFSSAFKPRLPKLVKEKESWMIIHAGEFIQYSYHVKSEKNVSSVYFLVPLNNKLSFSDSAYDIMQKAYSISDVADGATFNKEEIERIVSKCHLVSDDGLSVPFMEGKEPASFQADSKAQVSALLRFSKYKALRTVCQLEIGYECETTIKLPIKSKAKDRDLENLEIPKAIPLFEDSKTNEVEETTEEKKSFKPIILVVVLAIIAAIAGGVYFMNDNSSNAPIAKNDNKKIETPVDTQESQNNEKEKPSNKAVDSKPVKQVKPAEPAKPEPKKEKKESQAKKETPVKKEIPQQKVNKKEVAQPVAQPVESGKVKSREEYRQEILSFANQGNLSKITSLKKYLSYDEYQAMVFVLGDVKRNFPDFSDSGHRKLRKKINQSKPFKSIRQIQNLKNVLLMTSDD